MKRAVLSALFKAHFPVCLGVLLAVPACKPVVPDEDARLTASEDALGSGYTGHADYRLIFVGHAGPDFEPNQDLLEPTAAIEAREKVMDGLRAAALKSLIPMMGEITGHPSGAKQDLMDALLGLAATAKSSLAAEMDGILSGDSDLYPIVHEAWLIPWLEETGELFYDADKISMSPVGAANTLRVLPGDDGFPAKLESLVKSLRTKLAADGDAPVHLLAARYFLFAMPGKSRLTVRILLGLRGYETAFEKEDPKVKFQKLVVPDGDGEGITAALTLDVPLETGEAPNLHLSFGKFKGVEKGNFVMEEEGRAKTAPRLEGQVNKTGAGWIALNFAFQDLTMNLRSAQLQSLSTLVSPGLRIAGANWTVGGIRAASVDQAFQQEINATIDTEIQGALEDANEEILDGMLSKEVLEEAFRKIFNRR